MNAVLDSAQLCAERGWKATFYYKNGELLKACFITAADWEKQVVVVERVGERHLDPTLVSLDEIARIEPHYLA